MIMSMSMQALAIGLTYVTFNKYAEACKVKKTNATGFQMTHPVALLALGFTVSVACALAVPSFAPFILVKMRTRVPRVNVFALKKVQYSLSVSERDMEYLKEHAMQRKEVVTISSPLSTKGGLTEGAGCWY
jgi:hypothetical protein